MENSPFERNEETPNRPNRGLNLALVLAAGETCDLPVYNKTKLNRKLGKKSQRYAERSMFKADSLISSRSITISFH